MKFLLLSLCLLLFGQRILAAPCSSVQGDGPCTPDAGEETETAKQDIRDLIARAKEVDPTVSDLKEKYLAVRDNPAIGIEEKLAACEAYRAKKLPQDQLYKDAINKTAALYHVSPGNIGQVVVAKSSDPKLAWMSGLTAQWNPQATDSGVGVKLAVKIWGTDDKDHYGGLVHMETEPKDLTIDPRYAVTSPDGHTLILKGTFDLALKKEHGLGFLASVIFHETRHFNYLSRDCPDKSGTCSWASETEDERDAYAEQTRLARVFGLSGADKAAFIAQWRQFDAEVKAGRLKSFNPDPADAANWQKYYPRQINLEEEYQKLKDDVEASRREQQELADLDREEAEEREAERVRAQAATAAAVKQCGFEPLFDSDGNSGPKEFVGYTAEKDYGRGCRTCSYRAYNFPLAKTIDALKVALMLTRTCTSVNNGGNWTRLVEHVDPPCNNGISILNARADDADFLDGIRAAVWIRSHPGEPKDVYYYPCVAEKIRQMRFPMDLQKYERLFESETKRNAKLNKEADDAANRAQRRRGGDAHQGGGLNDDDHDRGHSTPQKRCGQDGSDPSWCF